MKMHKDTRATVRNLEQRMRECRDKADGLDARGLPVLATAFRSIAFKAEIEADRLKKR